jgi:hypothetical protein
MPDLVPVDHDPWAGLIPVDHDPFAVSNAVRAVQSGNPLPDTIGGQPIQNAAGSFISDTLAPGRDLGNALQRAYYGQGTSPMDYIGPLASSAAMFIAPEAKGANALAKAGGSTAAKRSLALVPAADAEKSFAASQFHPSPTDHNYDIISTKTGNPLGAISLDATDPKNLMVNFIHNYEGGGANSLGPAAVRDLRNEIKDRYPDVEKLYGKRVSGARQEAGVPRYGEYNYPKAAPNDAEISGQIAQLDDLIARRSKNNAGVEPAWGVDPDKFKAWTDQRAQLIEQRSRSAAEPDPPAAGNGAGSAPPAPTINAYHGSPHDFDRFDISRIGTGEGAQAYGHGLYFAENEGVARSYRDTLAKSARTAPNAAPGTNGAEFYLKNAGGDIGNAVAAIKRDMENGRDTDRLYGEPLSKALERLQSGDVNKIPGRMYQVAIKADPDHFLHWDKPLSEQSEYVKGKLNALDIPDEKAEMQASYEKRIRDAAPDRGSADRAIEIARGMISGERPRHSGQVAGGNGSTLAADWVALDRLAPGVDHNAIHDIAEMHPTTGEDIYAGLTGTRQDWDKSTAAARLRDAGIPGIKYLDQGSRGKGEGSHNYVVFDDKTIDILKKYGIAGLTAGGLGATSFRTTPVDHDPFASESQ